MWGLWKICNKNPKKTTTKTSSLAEASGKGGAKGGDDGRRWRSYLSGWRWEGLHTMSHDGFGPKSANTKRLQRCSCIHDFWRWLLWGEKSKNSQVESLWKGLQKALDYWPYNWHTCVWRVGVLNIPGQVHPQFQNPQICPPQALAETTFLWRIYCTNMLDVVLIHLEINFGVVQFRGAFFVG